MKLEITSFDIKVGDIYNCTVFMQKTVAKQNVESVSHINVMKPRIFM